MNNDRRKAPKSLAEQVRELSGTLADIKTALEDLKGEEEMHTRQVLDELRALRREVEGLREAANT